MSGIIILFKRIYLIEMLIPLNLQGLGQVGFLGINPKIYCLIAATEVFPPMFS